MRRLILLGQAFLRFVYWFNENDAAQRHHYVEALYWARKRKALDQ